MDDEINSDLEFKRYLQILRPYISQLTDSKVISICDAWIQRLSDCEVHEKTLRNKYIFALCYQLAKGNLEEPFLHLPPPSNLRPLHESISSDDSSTEVECLVVNADDPNTDVLYNNNNQGPNSETEYLSQANDFDNTNSQCGADVRSNISRSSRKHTVLCYACPEMMVQYPKYPSEFYEERTQNLIKKLREIKAENTLLHNELSAMKEESTNTKCDSFVNEVVKVDNATSAYLKHNESNATLKSLKFKLQEVQESRNHLINRIASLQEQLDNINEIKNTEIENIEAKHKLEVINLKSAIKEEVRESYEKKLEDMKESYEAKINGFLKEIQDLKLDKDLSKEEKNKIISMKDTEIDQLKNQIDDLKTHFHSVLENFVTKPSGNCNGDSMQLKAEQLEKRLNKMEKNKIKSARVYEAKMVQMQREKHLTECSLQLQIVRQRAQVVNEVTDENQVELTKALEKLETKYKDIVANVQATAIQRRMQDQLALESILQAACGIPNENNNSQGSNQFSKTMRNQNRSYDGEVSPLMHCHRVGNVGVSNKSFGDDSLVTGYCLNGERMGELFERVYIPQRDNPETK